MDTSRAAHLISSKLSYNCPGQLNAGKQLCQHTWRVWELRAAVLLPTVSGSITHSSLTVLYWKALLNS